MTNGNAFALKLMRSFGLIGSEQPGWLILAGLRISAVYFVFNYLFRHVLTGHVTLWPEIVVLAVLVAPILCFGVFCLSCVSILERHARQMSKTDALTGIGSRLWFFEQLDNRIAAGATGMLLYIDVDHFKSINDRFGHGAGNECLRAFALHLQRLLSANDLVGRIGGEEFAIFLDGAGQHSLRLLAAKACSGVVMDTVDGAPHVTCTIGVAELTRGLDRQTLLHRADMAMYEAKRRERGRLVIQQGDLFCDVAGAPSRGLAKRASYLPPETLPDDPSSKLGPMGVFMERTGLLSAQTLAERLRVLMMFMVIIYLANLAVRGLLLDDVAPLRELVIVLLNGAPYIMLMQAAVAHMVQLRQELQIKADTDPLTGLLNRRSFFSRVEAADDGVLVLIDADYFKAVNDAHGHDTGDSCLIDLAAHIRSLVRPEELVGRLGGEEFAIFMPCVPLHRALELEQALCSGITLTPRKGPPMRVTMSAGAAMISEAGGMDAALMRADLALYQAKKNGRARMCQAAA